MRHDTDTWNRCRANHPAGKALPAAEAERITRAADRHTVGNADETRDAAPGTTLAEGLLGFFTLVAVFAAGFGIALAQSWHFHGAAGLAITGVFLAAGTCWIWRSHR